jgi:hypothetical protein
MSELEQQIAALAKEVQYLRDCEEIRQAMYTYARGVDRGDQELLEPCFHDDAIDDHGNFSGSKADALAALAKSAKNPTTTASFHHLGNILIDVVGDEAHVETYFMASQRRELDGKTFTRMRVGRYFDHFVRENGKWQVIARRVVDDWSRLDEVVQTAAEVGPNNNHATRDRNDLSYSVNGFPNRHQKA